MYLSNKQGIKYSVITVALAGFLFGFDTIVISGADQSIQKLWNTGDWFHGIFIMSMALWGTVLGALSGGVPCDKFGRKKTLFWIGVLYLTSALGSSLATDPYVFSFFRFIGGVGVGASSVAAPIYISEIAPANKRGSLVATYQFNIVFGILIAFFSNYLIGSYIIENAWRWMLGIEAVPAIIYCVMILGIPNSPRWLLLRGNDEAKAKKLLQQLDPLANVEERIKAIKKSVFRKQTNFFSGQYNKPILLAFLLAFFNQVSGINFILYYAPRIFEAAGINQSNTLIASVPVSYTHLTLPTIYSV